ncbi:hypothetical protein BpHYR1_038604, partial [Brachionus plicatilis]
KAFTCQIKDIIENRNKIGEKLRENFENIENISNKFVKDGMDEDDAVANATFLVFKRGITSANLLRIHNLNSIVGAGSGIKFAKNSGGQFWRSMRVQSLAMRKVLSSLGVNVSRKAAMGFIRSGTVVLSTVFVYFDVNSLIECWKSKHPNMAQVEEIIKKFKEELDNLKELNKWLIESSIDPCDDVKTYLDSKEESNENTGFDFDKFYFLCPQSSLTLTFLTNSRKCLTTQPCYSKRACGDGLLGSHLCNRDETEVQDEYERLYRLM